jgi:hypothetical protein
MREAQAEHQVRQRLGLIVGMPGVARMVSRLSARDRAARGLGQHLLAYCQNACSRKHQQ